MLVIAFHDNTNFPRIFDFNCNPFVTNSTSVLGIDDCFQSIEIDLLKTYEQKLAPIIETHRW